MIRFRCLWLLIISLTTINYTQAAERIVTLSPHLTEWIYSLDAQQHLVGVSAFSDYPAEASELPVVADYQGVDFAALLALEPDLVLAWGGGNKPQDISRLKSLGISVYVSQPETLEDIANELQDVAKLVGRQEQSKALIKNYRNQLSELRNKYLSSAKMSVFYYMWSQPLMTIGQAAWANKVLVVCQAESVFNDSPIDYPQVTIKQVLLRKPQLLVAATNQPLETQEQFWAVHRDVIKAPLITADANALHRFTLRITGAIETLCQRIDAHR